MYAYRMPVTPQNGPEDLMVTERPVAGEDAHAEEVTAGMDGEP
jgi:hypothetical protein